VVVAVSRGGQRADGSGRLCQADGGRNLELARRMRGPMGSRSARMNRSPVDRTPRADLLALSNKQPSRGGLRRRRPHNKRYDGRNEGDSDPSLKSLDPEDRVSSPIAASPRPMGRHSFWERNLRFKTDGSEKVPQKGAPALVNAGMLGDRADAIFAAPEEISGFIKREC
jgi:cytochrome c